MTELSKAEKRSIDNRMRQIEYMITDLQSFIRVGIAEVVRRQGIESQADGYASNKRPNAGGTGEAELTSTEAAAARRIEVRVNDEQGEAIKRMFGGLDTAAKEIKSARASYTFVLTTGDKERGRQDETTSCDICGGQIAGTIADRKVRGMGSVCYKRYSLADKKYRAKYGARYDIAQFAYYELQAIDDLERRRCGEPTNTQITPRAHKIMGSDEFVGDGYEVSA